MIIILTAFFQWFVQICSFKSPVSNGPVSCTPLTVGRKRSANALHRIRTPTRIVFTIADQRRWIHQSVTGPKWRASVVHQVAFVDDRLGYSAWDTRFLRRCALPTELVVISSVAIVVATQRRRANFPFESARHCHLKCHAGVPGDSQADICCQCQPSRAWVDYLKSCIITIIVVTFY